jgi:hypothetical protein
VKKLKFTEVAGVVIGTALISWFSIAISAVLSAPTRPEPTTGHVVRLTRGDSVVFVTSFESLVFHLSPEATALAIVLGGFKGEVQQGV